MSWDCLPLQLLFYLLPVTCLDGITWWTEIPCTYFSFSAFSVWIALFLHTAVNGLWLLKVNEDLFPPFKKNCSCFASHLDEILPELCVRYKTGIKHIFVCGSDCPCTTCYVENIISPFYFSDKRQKVCLCHLFVHRPFCLWHWSPHLFLCLENSIKAVLPSFNFLSLGLGNV